MSVRSWTDDGLFRDHLLMVGSQTWGVHKLQASVHFLSWNAAYVMTLECWCCIVWFRIRLPPSIGERARVQKKSTLTKCCAIFHISFICFTNFLLKYLVTIILLDYNGQWSVVIKMVDTYSCFPTSPVQSSYQGKLPVVTSFGIEAFYYFDSLLILNCDTIV